jgi:cysteine synthase
MSPGPQPLDLVGLFADVEDEAVLRRALQRLHEQGIILPRFGELADPRSISPEITARLGGIDPDDPSPLNLFRVHWLNASDRRSRAEVAEHVILPPELTGVKAKIVVLFGDRFPLVAAHKVLAAYACLMPRLVTGRFDPTEHRAVWPSTGNYARGGVAISRLLGCRGVAVLPENMSPERFRWLERWVVDPQDIVRTPGSESNVREIFEACTELARDPGAVILNQFSELSNHLAHYLVTGTALENTFAYLRRAHPDLSLAAFVAATGSAGTLGAGDWLKDRLGTRIVAVEPLECPTMLYNGFGEHRIQGIGDKHIPLVHNVMNTDAVVAVSDEAVDSVDRLFNSEPGATCLRERGVAPDTIASLTHFGLSSICNVLASIKLAKELGLGEDDVILTVATDSSPLYEADRRFVLEHRFSGSFGKRQAAEVVAQHVLGADVSHVRELDSAERRRIFNLGYFTWVEQQGVPVGLFLERRNQRFWRSIRSYLQQWDELIAEANTRAGVALA